MQGSVLGCKAAVLSDSTPAGTSQNWSALRLVSYNCWESCLLFLCDDRMHHTLAFRYTQWQHASALSKWACMANNKLSAEYSSRNKQQNLLLHGCCEGLHAERWQCLQSCNHRNLVVKGRPVTTVIPRGADGAESIPWRPCQGTRRLQPPHLVDKQPFSRGTDRATKTAAVHQDVTLNPGELIAPWATKWPLATCRSRACGTVIVKQIY